MSAPRLTEAFGFGKSKPTITDAEAGFLCLLIDDYAQDMLQNDPEAAEYAKQIDPQALIKKLSQFFDPVEY